MCWKNWSKKSLKSKMKSSCQTISSLEVLDEQEADEP
jgi:hypothetical protein